MRRTLLQLTTYVIESFNKWDVPFPEPCRFLEVHEFLSTTKETVFPDHPNWSMLAEGLRDFQIMSFVFEQAEKCETDPAFRKRLKTTLKDSPLPQDDQDSHGRDTQLELYIGAICKNANLLPVTYGEPDLTCNVSGVECSIAAKRPKNFSWMRSALKKAAEQIEKWKRPGIIIFDTAIALNPENQHLRDPLDDNEFAELYRDFVNCSITGQEENILKWSNANGLLGIMFHDSVLRIDKSGELGLTGMTIGIEAKNGFAQTGVDWKAFNVPYWNALPALHHLPERAYKC